MILQMLHGPLDGAQKTFADTCAGCGQPTHDGTIFTPAGLGVRYVLIPSRGIAVLAELVDVEVARGASA